MLFLPVIPPESVRIGNLLSDAPNAIAFVYKDTAAFVLDLGGAYQAGICAPDDSYHRYKIDSKGSPVFVEWGRVANGMVMKLTAPHLTTVHVDFSKNWPGWTSTYLGSGKQVAGEAHTSTGVVGWHLNLEKDPLRNDGKGLDLRVGPDSAIRISAGFGEVPRFDQIDLILQKSANRYAAKKPTASGDFGDFLGAIADNLNNSRLYSNDNHLAAISVSRGWAPDPNNAPYFCWDSFFNGNLASLDDPAMARDTVRAILSWQTVDGLVPNFGHWKFADGRSSDDRSQPPVGSMCVWKLHQRAPSIAFLKEVYPKLLKWHRWWPQARDGKHDGLLEWGSSKQGMQEALWETGWDDTVHFEGSKVAGNTLDAYAVDLNSMWIMDAQYLARIAKTIGHNDDAKQLMEEAARTAQLMNDKLWNPALGIYCSRLWSGQFLTRLTPMNFYPLIAGVADKQRASQVLAVMTDPKRFWGDWVLPTVAYDDPAWPQQNYWRGKVWAPVNYIVFQGLLQYASPDVLNTFAEKSVTLFMRNWTEHGVCGENYLSKDGTQSSDPHYTWGALLCLIGLENTVCLLPGGELRLNGTINSTFDLHNVRINGKRYDVVVSPHRTELKFGARTVRVAQNQVLNFHL